MIISCPACESRFNIDPGRVPPAGRQVRCGKCSHVWRIAADGNEIPIAADSPPALEPAVADSPSGISFGTRAPQEDEPSAMPAVAAAEEESPESATDSPVTEQAPEPLAQADSEELVGSEPEAAIGDGATAEPDSAEKIEGDAAGEKAEVANGEAEAGSVAGPIPPLLGSAMTPNARQKLAEARKGRSRVRFLVIALVLMIVAALAVSFIRRPDGLNDALRMVPGLEESLPAETPPAEPPSEESTDDNSQ